MRRAKVSDDRIPASAAGRRGVDGELAQASPRPLAAYLWSALALLLGLALTLAVHYQQQRRQSAERDYLHGELASKSYASVLAQLHAAEMLLRSAQTLFLASDGVDRDEFHYFYVNQRPREQLPSLQAFAYVRREAAAQGDRYITTWVEPLRGNEPVVGLDVGAQPRNLAALMASRDTDRPTLSAPFHLLQQHAGTPADGVTFRLPIYSSGAPPQTVAQRRERMRGSLAVSFRVSALIGSSVPAETTSVLRLRISDVTDDKPLLLFDSLPGAAPLAGVDHLDRKLHYGGRVWLLDMQPLDDSAQTIEWSESTLPGGVVASVLLALLVFSVAITRERALELGWRMSRRYRESEERFRALNELLPALVLLADAGDGRITYANQATRERLGAHVGERNLPELFEDFALDDCLHDPSLEGCSRIEAKLRNGQGIPFWASVAIARVTLGGLDKLLMVATDVTEQRALTDQLGYQASHDALTDLYNRREFERCLQHVLRDDSGEAPSALLLYIDLDQFKLINDTSGHPAGDELLAQLAIVMRRHLGGADVLARLGGDEFGVLARDVTDRSDVEAIAERLRRCIDGYVFIWEKRSYTISASIGAVLIDRAGATVRDLLAQADTACYMAKELGRNRVHFYSELDDQTTRRRSEMEWANRLRWAVDEHRLVLAYQEIWPLPLTGMSAKVGIELLLRFRDEFGQLLAPGVFLPAAERYGLMPVIDRWVIETALANFDQLHPAGSSLPLVAINLSGASIEDDELADLIIERLQRHEIEPSRVCFEITETVAVRNLSQVVRFMERLRGAGCKLALDDFGAGMSSFTYLKNLPVDIIKIDGSFIRDLLINPVSHAMVQAVTDIGHRLGLEVVAEWVTDTETVDVLTALGVDSVQGFSLHRPELVPFHRD